MSTCSLTDVTCMCDNEDLLAQITACVGKTCTVKEALSKKHQRPSRSLLTLKATKKVTSAGCGVPVRSKSNDIEFVAIICGATAVVVSCLRLLSRYRTMTGALGLDDWAILAATVIKP